MPRLSYLPRDGIDSNHLEIYIIIPLMIFQSQSKSYHQHTSETKVPIEHLPLVRQTQDKKNLIFSPHFIVEIFLSKGQFRYL